MVEHYGYDFSKSGVAPEALAREVVGAGEMIAMIRQELAEGGYATPAAFCSLPADQALFAQAQAIATRLRADGLTHVIVVGIGGSSLGTRAIVDALNADGVGKYAKLLFAETVSPIGARALATELAGEVFDPGQIALFIVSKSGTTTETVANAALLIKQLEERLGDIRERIVAITDDGSPLAEFVARAGYAILTIPTQVGGRYSVFSPAGVAPLLAAGFPVHEILAGARATNEAFRASTNDEPHPSIVEAATIAAQTRAGMHTHNLFLFDLSLESLGKWWRQLSGESLGKEHDRAGNAAVRGMLPVVSVGSTDLHSVGQWYVSGAPGVATTFLELGGVPDVAVPQGAVADLLPGLAGKPFGEVMSAIAEGAARAYASKGLPLVRARLAHTPQALGAWIQHQMLATAIAGGMLNLNPFDQPNVEEYKRETRAILGLVDNAR